MSKLTLGFALTGSFCTFERAIKALIALKDEQYNIIPIMSFNAYSLDTRFGKSEDFINTIEDICKNKIIHTLNGAEPIGPKKMFDALVVCPCTGNTLAKLTAGIADTPVTLAVKSHLRNLRPVIIAVSSNDSLAAAAKNIGILENRKNYYFVPYRQDDPSEKPNSIVADFSMLSATLNDALKSKQIQPIII